MALSPDTYSVLETAAAAEKDPTAAAAEKDPTTAAAEKKLTQLFRLQKIGELEAFLRSEIESRSPSLYPTLKAVAVAEKDQTPQFRLQKIGELEAFLRSEIESRSRLHKKHRRAVNVLDYVGGSLGTSGMGMSGSGFALMFTGVAFIPGAILEGLAVLTALAGIVAIPLSRHCSKKATKHDEIHMLALSKLNTIHSHISKALEDCLISDEEYKLILDEIEKYRAMKDEIRRKAVTGTAIIDEEAKNELLKRGREEARADILKQLGTSAQPSP